MVLDIQIKARFQIFFLKYNPFSWGMENPYEYVTQNLTRREQSLVWYGLHLNYPDFPNLGSNVVATL
jgi:hypothetical protein